jgi:nucleoside-diphosphate-sugar epimerase
VAGVAIAATAHLAEAAVSAGAKTFVYASSGGIYGPSERPIRESDPIRPAAELGFYLAAKAAAEQLLGYFSPHLTVHILRPFFVYGPGQGETFLLPRLIRSVRTGTPIRVDGGRGTILNPVYCEDAAAIFAATLDRLFPRAPSRRGRTSPLE